MSQRFTTISAPFAIIAVVSLFALVGASFGATLYTTGIQKGDDPILEIRYKPIALEKGENIEALRKGEIGESMLEGWNNGSKLGKIGKLVASQGIEIGDTKVEKGEYDCGLNVDKEGNFSFVVWKGEEAQATSIELYEHDAPSEYLILSLSPSPHGEGSALWVAYGKYAAGVPVSVGEVSGSSTSKEEAYRYSTGLSMDDESVIHLSYHPTEYAEGKNFQKMRDGEMDDRFNEDKSFGKVGLFKNTTKVKVGDLPDAPPGEYPCGINVDGEGAFTFVGWSNEGVHKTPIKLEKHGFTVPHLALILSHAGDKGSNLRLIYGEYHADIDLSIGASGS